MVACLSPNGPTVYRAAAPPLRLYVGAQGGVSVLERAGPSSPWRVARRALAGRHVSAMMCDDAGTWVLAGIHDGGLEWSTDNGATWARRDAGVTVPHAFALARGQDDRFYLGTLPAALFKSRDRGASWAEIASFRTVPGQEKWTFPGLPHEAHAKCVAIDPRDPALLYVAVEQGGLFRSRDGGESWRELDSYYRAGDKWYRDIHRLVIDATDPRRLFMTTGMGLYRSDDGGESWDHLTDTGFRIGYPDHLVISPKDPRVIYMCGGSLDPTQWRRSHRAEATVMVSRDRGETWGECGAGLPDDRRANLEAMSIVHHGAGFTLFAGNTDGEVFSSEDEGAHWTRIAAGLSPISKLGHYELVVPA
ncbi:MAG TPA: hypothetical protein VL993_09075 [Stellaceae bacterium]|nr:hypothetical protein [Stellaceae bacterium]